MAQNGILKRLNPPGNTGLLEGTGTISSEDVSYNFITPTANHNRELTVHKPVTFTLVEGVVTSVSQDG